jgi:hypothetical protein
VRWQWGSVLPWWRRSGGLMCCSWCVVKWEDVRCGNVCQRSTLVPPWLLHPWYNASPLPSVIKVSVLTRRLLRQRTRDSRHWRKQTKSSHGPRS